MSGGDSSFPVFFGGVAGQFEQFGREVFQNGAEVDGRAKANFGRVESGF